MKVSRLPLKSTFSIGSLLYGIQYFFDGKTTGKQRKGTSGGHQ